MQIPLSLNREKALILNYLHLTSKSSTIPNRAFVYLNTYKMYTYHFLHNTPYIISCHRLKVTIKPCYNFLLRKNSRFIYFYNREQSSSYNERLDQRLPLKICKHTEKEREKKRTRLHEKHEYLNSHNAAAYPDIKTFLFSILI